MKIETKFNVGDTVYYLSGQAIYSSTVNKIIFEREKHKNDLLVIYLADGLQIPNNVTKLFATKQDLLNYLSEKIWNYNQNTSE